MITLLSSMLFGIASNANLDFSSSKITNYMIIGEDNRNLINNTKSYPSQSVVKIKTFFEDTYIECTGSVIDKNTVLTAAHCVYSGEKETPENIIIVPGQNKQQKPYGSYSTNKYVIPSKYSKKFDYNYDIALIKINSLYKGKLIGENVKPLNIQKNKNYMNLQVSTIGYPTDKTEMFGVTQWRDKGTIVKQFENKFGYYMDTMNGQSGAPIFNKRNDIIGIHTTGNNKEKINYATQINEETYKWLKTH